MPAIEDGAPDCKAHSGVMQNLATLEEGVRDLWKAVNLLRYRLPVWATFLFMCLSAAVGVLGTMVVKA